MIPAGAVVHFVQGDDPSDDLNDSQQDQDEFTNEDDFEAVPEVKSRQLEPEVSLDYPLTKFLSQERVFEPCYSGGKFYIYKAFSKRAIALKDGKLALIDLENSQKLKEFEQENEEILNFAVSPNERLIATTHKNWLTKVFFLNQVDSV